MIKETIIGVIIIGILFYCCYLADVERYELTRNYFPEMTWKEYMFLQKNIVITHPKAK